MAGVEFERIERALEIASASREAKAGSKQDRRGDRVHAHRFSAAAKRRTKSAVEVVPPRERPD